MLQVARLIAARPRELRASLSASTPLKSHLIPRIQCDALHTHQDAPRRQHILEIGLCQLLLGALLRGR